MAMAQLNGCTADELRNGMKTYGGVDRRFDFKIKNDKLVFLSDYAHHPKEIYQSAKSIRELYKDRKITAIFQPHLYTRTRDFYKDFANSLSLLDEVILCDIYPAREQPIPGVTSKLIYDNLKPGVEKSMIHKEDVLDLVKSRDFDVLVILGAGDLDNYVPQITEILEEKYKCISIGRKPLSSPWTLHLAPTWVFAFTKFNKPDEKGMLCTKVNINIQDEMTNGFLNAKEIKKRLEIKKLYPLEKPLSNVNARKIEETLKTSPFVKTAECYKTQDGLVDIYLTQRMPIVRIKSINNEDYYIDDHYQVMPNTNYTSDIIIATGNINKWFAQKYISLVSKTLMTNESLEKPDRADQCTARQRHRTGTPSRQPHYIYR